MTAADVILALVKASVTLGQATDAPVFDAHVPDNPPARYVVVYPSPPMRSADDLAFTPDGSDFTWQVTCVGATRAEVEWLAVRTSAALVGVRPTVPGLSCGVIRHDGSQPIRPDANIPGRVVLYCIDQYAMFATAA